MALYPRVDVGAVRSLASCSGEGPAQVLVPEHAHQGKFSLIPGEEDARCRSIGSHRQGKF